jgi:hypothetical protein
MKIEIGSLDVPYAILSNLSEGEVTAGDQDSYQDNSVINGIQYSQSMLVYPFDDAFIRFKRFGDDYSALVMFDSLDEGLFAGDTRIFEKAVEAAKYKFIMQDFNSPRFQGYLLNEKKEKKFALRIVNQGSMQIISMGAHGTETYRFPDSEDDFRRQVGNLERMANIYIDSVLQAYPDREEVRFFEDQTILLHP